MKLFHRKFKFNWEDYKNIDLSNNPIVIAEREYMAYLESLQEGLVDSIKDILDEAVKKEEKRLENEVAKT